VRQSVALQFIVFFGRIVVAVPAGKGYYYA